MGSRNAAILAVALAALGAPLAGATPARLPKAPLSDLCRAVPGYAEFRSELVDVARRRDGPAFQRLFMATGGMRVEGMGGRGGSAADWRWDRPEAAQMWRELDALLPLGCAPQGDKLILPAMGRLVDDPRVEPGLVAALRSTRAYGRPAAERGKGRPVAAGQLLTRVREAAPGWIEVMDKGRSAFVRAEDVRSIHDYQMVLKREQGRWRIWEFNSGV